MSPRRKIGRLVLLIFVSLQRGFGSSDGRVELYFEGTGNVTMFLTLRVSDSIDWQVWNIVLQTIGDGVLFSTFGPLKRWKRGPNEGDMPRGYERSWKKSSEVDELPVAGDLALEELLGIKSKLTESSMDDYSIA
jgi:hypothetical protein